eukprot:SAG31_NODE_3610_length_4068_cov_2.700176_3_plen_192_part_00
MLTTKSLLGRVIDTRPSCRRMCLEVAEGAEDKLAVRTLELGWHQGALVTEGWDGEVIRWGPPLLFGVRVVEGCGVCTDYAVASEPITGVKVLAVAKDGWWLGWGVFEAQELRHVVEALQVSAERQLAQVRKQCVKLQVGAGRPGQHGKYGEVVVVGAPSRGVASWPRSTDSSTATTATMPRLLQGGACSGL